METSQAYTHQLEDGYYVDVSELINQRHKIELPTQPTAEDDFPVRVHEVQLRGNSDNQGGRAYAKVIRTLQNKKGTLTTDNPKVFVGHFDKLIEKVKARLNDDLKQETDLEIETIPSEENFDAENDSRLIAKIKKPRFNKVTEHAPIGPEYFADYEPDATYGKENPRWKINP